MILSNMQCEHENRILRKQCWIDWKGFNQIPICSSPPSILPCRPRRLLLLCQPEHPDLLPRSVHNRGLSWPELLTMPPFTTTCSMVTPKSAISLTGGGQASLSPTMRVCHRAMGQGSHGASRHCSCTIVGQQSHRPSIYAHPSL